MDRDTFHSTRLLPSPVRLGLEHFQGVLHVHLPLLDSSVPFLALGLLHAQAFCPSLSHCLFHRRKFSSTVCTAVCFGYKWREFYIHSFRKTWTIIQRHCRTLNICFGCSAAQLVTTHGCFIYSKSKGCSSLCPVQAAASSLAHERFQACCPSQLCAASGKGSHRTL